MAIRRRTAPRRARTRTKRYGPAWDVGLEIGGALSPPLPSGRGVDPSELARAAAEGDRVIARLMTAGAPSGFLTLPRRSRVFDEIVRSARRWRRAGIRDVLQIGIGGSSLGAECVFHALAHPAHNLLPDARRKGPRLHFLDNVDPDRLHGLLDALDLRHTLIHVVSKSGGTVETAAGFQLVRGALRETLPKSRRDHAMRDHVVATTGAGQLHEFCLEEDIEIIDFPSDIGGRFSVFTASGLFAPAVLGLDITGLVQGARRMVNRLTRDRAQDNLASSAAAVAFLLATQRGIATQVFFPYADALEPLARWMVQLTAESLGKADPAGTGRRSASGVGSTPIPARGTTDQHSQVQLFVEGPADKLVVFVTTARSGRDMRLPNSLPDEDPAAYLAGVPLGELLRAEQAGTAIALAEAERPTLCWRLPELHPYTLGQLLVAWEAQTAVHADLLGVNAYDQPGVEAGKVAAFALIGREGFEGQRRRIERARPSPVWVGGVDPEGG
jgi:glucose-6-phosphate isomerase